MINKKNYFNILEDLKPFNATLVAVSKTKPIEDLLELKNLGQKIFGENYVQELTEKHNQITEVEWHFIGHLQTNKVKQIVPFVNLIHGVDSEKLLIEINKQSLKQNRITDCLLQLHIAKEETKFGFSSDEVNALLDSGILSSLKNVRVRGFMGMSSLTDDSKIIREEFISLKKVFDRNKSEQISILSMGMTNDYKIALEEGSTMVRIGSAIFGERK